MFRPIFKRGIHTINVGGIKENILQRTDYPLNKCRKILENVPISVIGYGPQGCGQALNLRDNGFDVSVGVRKGPSWDKALEDGWEENKNLFSVSDATEKANVVQYLLSDVGQIKQWNTILPHLTEGKTLYFSHGFGLVFNDKTKIVPPSNIDVMLVAPKGAGATVRTQFLKGTGINASYSIHQNFTGEALDKCMALAFGIGCGHAFETTFEKEVLSDLTGERCVLMGLIQGAFAAQYNVLREKGHSPSEAYNETVEEALVSLYPLISDKGMDWLYANCSTTAQRGALDWAPKFEKVLKPIIEECYNDVQSGKEVQRVIDCNSDENYREKLNLELDKMANQELWQVAKILRELRP
jgi:ketol-acid reductoisomerase